MTKSNEFIITRHTYTEYGRVLSLLCLFFCVREQMTLHGTIGPQRPH